MSSSAPARHPGLDPGPSFSSRPDSYASYASNEDWAGAGFPVPAPGENYGVVAVRVIGPLTLWVEHADGTQGEIRFMPDHLNGVFEQLRDPAVFAQVRVEHGAVTWPGELDIAPDNMHRHLAAFGEWVL